MIQDPCEKRDGESLEGALAVGGVARIRKHCTLGVSLIKGTNGGIPSLKL